MYTSSVIFRLVCSHILKSTLRCNLSVAILLNVYAEHIIITKILKQDYIMVRSTMMAPECSSTERRQNHSYSDIPQY